MRTKEQTGEKDPKNRSAVPQSGAEASYYRPTVSAYDVPRNQTENNGKPRKEITLYIPPGWFRMFPAAVAALVLPLLVIMSLTVIAYFSTAGNVWLAEITWTDALTAGVNIWAMGYGVSLSGKVEGIYSTLSVSPLGLIWFNIFWSAFLIRHLLGSYRISAWFFVPAQLILTSVIGFSNARAFALWQLVVGSGVIAVISVLLALYQDERARRDVDLPSGFWAARKAKLRLGIEKKKQTIIDFFRRVRRPDLAFNDDEHQQELGIDRDAITIEGSVNTWIIPGWVISGIRAGYRIFLFLGVVTFFLLLVQMILHFQQVKEINSLLHINLLGLLVLSLVQLVYFPTLQAWALAWLSGPGFQQGTGTNLSIWENSTGPYPAVPILATLPNYTPGVWPIIVCILVAAIFGYILYIYQARVDLFYHLATALTAVLTLGMLTVISETLATGSLGPGRMQSWGADPLLVTAAVLFEWMVPLCLVMIFMHPIARNKLVSSLHALVSGGLRQARQVAKRTQDLATEVAKDASEYLHRNDEDEDEGSPDPDQPQTDEETVLETCQQPDKDLDPKTATQQPDSSSKVSVDDSAEQAENTGAKEETGRLAETSDMEEKGTGTNRAPNQDLEPIIPPVGKKTRLSDLGSDAFMHSRGGNPDIDQEQIKEVADKWVKRKVRRVRHVPVQVPKPDLNDPAVPKQPVKRSVLKRSQVHIDLYHRPDGRPLTAGLPTADTTGMAMPPLPDTDQKLPDHREPNQE